MPKGSASAFRSRIVGSGTASPAEILANPRNWRQHPEEQEAALEGLLKDVGWVQQVIVNRTTGHLVDGHLRVALAKKRGEPQVPVIFVELNEEEERLVLATIDPIGGLAQTDQGMLDALLEGVASDHEGLQALLDSLVSQPEEEPVEGETDEDETPGPRVIPTTRPGDVWLLGDHRLLCGDSTSAEDVARAAGQSIDCVWTDPPYNVAYEGGTKDKLTIMNDAMDGARFRAFLTDAFTAAFKVCREGAPIYIAHADIEGLNFRTAMTDAGWLHKQSLVWVKNSLVLGRQDYQWQHEPILYGWKPGAGHSWYGERNKTTVLDDDIDLDKADKATLLRLLKDLKEHPSTVIREDKPTRNDVHPTMKPVGLIERMVLNSTRPGDTVLDLFGGSGSTLIACHKHRRRARLLELDPIYCDVIVRRWQDYAGAEAILESTGGSFAEVELARAVKA
jgi:DNA modification methylase